MAYEISKETPRKAVTVQGLEVQMPLPFSEGHQLTGPEAAVLNQTFVENIRNNNAKAVKDAAAAGSPMTAKDLQDVIDTYVSTYEFGVRRAGGARIVRDPVEHRARLIAGETLKKALSDQGFSKTQFIKEFGRAKYEAYIDELLENNPQIGEEAARQVEAERKGLGKKLKIDLDIPAAA